MGKRILFLLVGLLSLATITNAQKLYGDSEFRGTFRMVPKDAPAVGAEGSFYVDSANGLLYISNGTEWSQIGELPEGVVFEGANNTLTGLNTFTNKATFSNVVDLNSTINMTSSAPAILMNGSSSGNTVRFSMLNSTSGACQFYFGDPEDSDAGRFQYANSGDEFTWHTGGIQRMRLNSTGLDLTSLPIFTSSDSPINSSPSGINAPSGNILTANGSGGSSWLPPAEPLASTLQEVTTQGAITTVPLDLSGGINVLGTYENVRIGTGSLSNLTEGQAIGNIAVGSDVLSDITFQDGNIGIGTGALEGLNEGSESVAIGRGAGKYQNGGFTVLNTISSNSVFIGANSRSNPIGFSDNEIVIGALAEGHGTNTATIGNSSITHTYIQGKAMLTDVLNFPPINTPSIPIRGDIYNDSLDGNLRIYDGSSFSEINSVKSATIDISNSQLLSGTDVIIKSAPTNPTSGYSGVEVYVIRTGDWSTPFEDDAGGTLINGGGVFFYNFSGVANSNYGSALFDYTMWSSPISIGSTGYPIFYKFTIPGAYVRYWNSGPGIAIGEPIVFGIPDNLNVGTGSLRIVVKYKEIDYLNL